MKRSTLTKVQIESPPSNNRLEATFETQFLLKLIRNTNHYSILNSLRERRIKTGSDQEKILVARTQAFFAKSFPLHCWLLNVLSFELEFPRSIAAAWKNILWYSWRKKSSFMSLSPNVEESRLFSKETSPWGRRRDKTKKNKQFSTYTLKITRKVLSEHFLY